MGLCHAQAGSWKLEAATLVSYTENLKQNDLLAVMSAGAYGFSMSSNYNSRKRAAEVLVNGNKLQFIRIRESYDDLIRNEIVANV